MLNRSPKEIGITSFLITVDATKTHEVYIVYSKLSLIARLVKNPPAMQETQVQFLGQEDPLEKGPATHSSILPGGFHGQRRLADYYP